VVDIFLLICGHNFLQIGMPTMDTDIALGIQRYYSQGAARLVYITQCLHNISLLESTGTASAAMKYY